MNVEEIDIELLLPDPANVRLHPQKNLDAIKGSLRRFGQQKPVVIDADNVVRAGNGTLAAAKALGWKALKCVRSALTASELTAFAIADNRTAELAEWDKEELARLLEEVGEVGFDEDDIAELLGKDELPEAKDADDGAAGQFMVIITCKSEREQVELLERLSGEGLECKAVVG